MNVYRHMVCIDASDVAYATSALTTLYTQAEQIFALKDGKPTYPADKIAHGDVICIDFSDGGTSVSALVHRQNEKDGGIVYASAITDEEGVMLTFDEDGIYKSKQQVAFTFPTTGGTLATEEKYDPIIPTTLHGDASSNQVTLYHDASQLSGQTPLQLKTVGGQSLIGSGDIQLSAAQSRTSRAI